jgi:tetratricopeptide (TPR) repeat protein
LGAFQKALDELHSIDLKNIIYDWPNVYAAVLGNLGVAYLKIGNRELAKKYFIKAFKIAKKEKNLNIELYQYINLGEYFFSRKQYDSCYKYFNKALVHSKKLKAIDEYKLVLRYLSKVDFNKDNYYNELYIAVSDSLTKAQLISRDKYARIEYETSVDSPYTIEVEDPDDDILKIFSSKNKLESGHLNFYRYE